MIVFCHLLNDSSGSPKILAEVINGLQGQSDEFRLFVGSDGSGFLDSLGVRVVRYWYKRTPYRFMTLCTYLMSQLSLLIRLLRTRDIPSDALIYVNTLLPFGAAIYGLLTGRPVIYHLHEVSISPAPLRLFLTAIARSTACRLIYVSDFHRSSLPIPGVPASTVFNALAASILSKANESQYRPRKDGRFRVLMLASLRDYKGVPEFIELAKRLVDRKYIEFDLVANDDGDAINRYFKSIILPSNLTIHPRTADTASHYSNASLVMNLSRPDQCIETFGLTLLEAMAFGIPVIAPPVGGPLELVTEGQEGFLIDCRNGEALAEKVCQLADNDALCFRLSAAARIKAMQFSPLAFARMLRSLLKFYLLEKSRK